VISRLLLRASNATQHVTRSSGSRESLDHACYATLIALADEHINNVDFHVVASRWLELYVDANLLSALHDIAVCNLDPSNADLVSRDISVRKLDMAIIVGGATRTRRMEWIQRAIKLAQVKPDVMESGNDKRPSPDVPRKRARLDSESELLYAPNVVPSLPIPPSLDGYVSRHCQAPFVLRGYLAKEDGPTPPWPALTRWKDAEYLLSRIGRGRWVPVEEGRAYDDRDWGQRIVPFEDFLERAGFYDNRRKTAMPTDRPMYLAQHSLFRQFPDLESDMTLPDYVWSRPPIPSDFPSYREPDTRDGVIVNVWVGSGSGEIISPAHTVSE
jgi:lysine-specific demethylase 8